MSESEHECQLPDAYWYRPSDHWRCDTCRKVWILQMTSGWDEQSRRLIRFSWIPLEKES